MKLAITGLLLLITLTGCSSRHHAQTADPRAYDGLIQDAADEYGVDAKLIKAIIGVESGFNPGVVSASNAIGLMQLKAATAGCDAYRMKGKRGCPDDDDLLDAGTNIDLGAAYLSMIQNKQLYKIDDPVTLRYATEAAYVNGAGALLRTFSADRRQAIAMINSLTPAQFYWHIKQKHPAAQAPRYMAKVEAAYEKM